MLAAALLVGLAVAAADGDPAPGPAPPEAEVGPEQLYKRGKNLFEYGDCPGTLGVLAPLAVPGRLQDERQQQDVHRMLGICYALADKQLEAAREFSSLLSIEPDFALDPFLTPPAAIEIFDRQKAAMKAQLEELRHARDKARENSPEDSGGVLVERTTLVKETPLAVSFMPFGLAQAANGETVKGVIVGSVQGLCLATTIGTFWGSMAILANSGNRGTKADAAQQKATFDGLLYAHVISAMGFALGYGYGVGDALWNREDRTVVEKKESKRPLTPAEIQLLKKVAPAAPAPPAPAGVPPPG